MNTIAIYGAGGCGRKFLAAMRAAGADAGLFIDRFSDATEVDGVPVYRPDVVPPGRYTVHVSTAEGNPIIARELRDAGFDVVRDFHETVMEFPGIIDLFRESLMCYHPDASHRVAESELEQVADLLTDDRSKQSLNDIVRFRMSLSGTDYPRRSPEVQYFPQDIDLFSGIDGLRMVDVGAYTGDTVDAAIANAPVPVQWVVCFEAFGALLPTLNATLARHRIARPHTDFFTYPCALWSRTELLAIENAGGSTTRVAPAAESDDPGCLVQGIALDDALANASPNYIKMDIEGSELAALQGMRTLIGEHRPCMAVCVYHRPADLWQIPLFIANTWPNYRMHLRTHGELLQETVLYCIPQD